MTVREQAMEHRERLLAVVDDDADVRGIPLTLAGLSETLEIDAGAALLFLLTGLEFEEPRARRHWEAIIDDLQELRVALRRPVAVRTAILDYFVNIHPRLEMPVLVAAADPEALAESRFESRASAVRPDLDGAVRFRESVDYEVRRARRYHGRVGLVLTDLDDFAQIDARLGRDEADRLLAAVGRVLETLARPFDRVGRPGEDEFAVLMPGADRDETETLAHALRAAVASLAGESRSTPAAPTGLTTSVGYAVFPDDGLAGERLLERAAQALYEAKRAGGDRVVGWHSERRRGLRHDPAPGWKARVRIADRETFDAVELYDVSRDGLAFLSPRPIAIGAELEINLETPRDAPKPSIARDRRGVVVHLDDAPSGPRRPEAAGPAYRVGVAFSARGGGPSAES